MRNYPKLLITKSKRRCVEKCPETYTEIDNQCFKIGQKRENIQELPQAFMSSWHWILLVCFISFVFSYICLLLYRYCAKYVIWIINIGFIVFLFLLGSLFLTKILGEPKMKMAIMLYILGAISIVALIVFRKQIALVAEIFKESSKALMDVPGIMFEPILVSFFVPFFI